MTIANLSSLDQWNPEAFMEMNESAQTMFQDYLSEHMNNVNEHLPFPMSPELLQLWKEWLSNPMPLVAAAQRFWLDYFALSQSSVQKMYGLESDDIISPTRGDRRFSHECWDDNVAFDYIKQFYLLASRYIYSTVSTDRDLDSDISRKLMFYTRQWVDALSPTNFAATNPAVLQETINSHGTNLYRGIMALIEDYQRGKGKHLMPRMTDYSSFEVGRNVATTPGKVIFQSDMFQLIQYAPSTEKVFEKPLLIVPPWINKFYILDLRAENSFIKWAVDQGHTVFVISWVNPDKDFADKTFADYMTEGVMKAVEVIKEETGSEAVNAIGYCIGGTLLASTSAWYAKKHGNPFASITYFTTLIDFEESGDLGVFVDEKQLKLLEVQMKRDGYLEGSTMAMVFNLLRANDLIWPFIINNYLLGKGPEAFDLLYWNSDSTRLPAANHIFYLRNFYIKNLLCKPDALKLAGVKLDIGKIKTPSYFVSTREDHITPWKSCYAGARLFKGPVRFVLGGSGHIAGVINPPVKNKYCFWTNDTLADDAEGWLARATEHPGSWWPDWQKWVAKYAGKKVPAREAGASLGVIEDAPGSYVKKRIVPD
jgi:polyhydroxyalkanoate synthase